MLNQLSELGCTKEGKFFMVQANNTTVIFRVNKFWVYI